MNAVAATRPRILLVDDSMLMRKAASKMLGDEFDVITAKDGIDGWDQILADPTIQVVFTDLSMPRMDGYALLQKVRGAEDEDMVNLPVIVVTGAENDDSARKKALDLGATDFITKPFGSVDLIARARAHANHRRMARKLEAQSLQDALTGLANKAGYLDRLQQDIAFARRHAQPLTLVRIEIDGFRNVFLKQGKAVAEELILHVAQHLRATVRKEDTAARIGLASFALSLPAGQHLGSKGLIERMRAQFAAEAPLVGGKPLAFTISAAVTTPLLAPTATGADLLDGAERLLQAAVQEGGNRVLGESSLPPETDDPTDLEMRVVQVSARLDAGDEADAAAGELAVAEAMRAAASLPSTGIGAAPPVAVAAPAAEVPLLVDEALLQIERGESLVVIPRLPQLLKRLLPLFRLLNPRQRAQLVMILQRLGV
jgi:two-component system, cell cycle response regulator